MGGFTGKLETTIRERGGKAGLVGRITRCWGKPRKKKKTKDRDGREIRKGLGGFGLKSVVVGEGCKIESKR